METQFAKLGAVIKSFTLDAISAKDAWHSYSDDEVLVLAKIRELETETNIEKAGNVVLKSLCALGLEVPVTGDQDDSTLSVSSLLQCNNKITEMVALVKLPNKSASESWALKLSTETHRIFDEESVDKKSKEHFDKILKLTSLTKESVLQLQELTETQQKLIRKRKFNQKLMKELHYFSDELDAQRIELENKSNIEKEDKMILRQNIYKKLEKTNTTRMLINILLTISNIDFSEKRPFIKLLKVCRNPATMEQL